ncbi:hypothetical protein H5410_001858, partial [Solanum commersonii]
IELKQQSGARHFQRSNTFHGVSQIGFNYENFEDLADSFTLTQVNAMIIDVVNIDEQLFVMTQTIEALNKSIKRKDLQFTQLMTQLDLYFPRESSQNLTPQE